MVKRRGHNEGTIYRDETSNRWVAQMTLANGKRKSFYGKTRKEVQTRLTAALHDRELGLPIAEERQTVAQFLASWLETMRPPKLVEETWLRYKTDVDLRIVPALGVVRLALLTPQQVQTFYAALLATQLSSTSVRHCHAVLHRALASALRLGLVARNVADLVDKPKKRIVEIHPLSRDELHRYLDAIADDRLAPFFLLASATGMRVGELLALRWRAVDLEARNVRVLATLKRRQGRYLWERPKSQKSRRQIALAEPAVEALRLQRTRQLTERLAAGAAWQDNDLVFSDEIGRPVPYTRLRWRHARILRQTKLSPELRIHDLRHTCATLLLSQRVNPKVVSELLGHATVAFTLDIYAHVLPDMQEDAAAVMTAILRQEAQGALDALEPTAEAYGRPGAIERS